MRLKLFEAMETEVGLATYGRQRIGAMSVTPRGADIDELRSLSRQRKRVVDYRIRVGARQIVPDTDQGITDGKRKVALLPANHLYDDLHKELIDLWEWACDEGIGSDLEAKLERLIKLTRGDDVE